MRWLFVLGLGLVSCQKESHPRQDTPQAVQSNPTIKTGVLTRHQWSDTWVELTEDGNPVPPLVVVGVNDLEHAARGKQVLSVYVRGNQLCGLSFPSRAKLSALAVTVTEGVVADGQRFIDADQLACLAALRPTHVKLKARPDATVLPALHATTHLDLYNVGLDASDFSPLAATKQLKWLDVSENRVGDSPVSQLARLANLTYLDIGDMGITGAAVRDFAQLKKLTKLSLFANKNFGDDGLVALRQLPVESLDLGNTGVSDKGMADVAAMRSLTNLGLAANYKVISAERSRFVGDDGARALAACPRLVSLDMRSTRLTASGLQELARIRTLRTLNIGATDVREINALRDTRLVELDISDLHGEFLPTLKTLKHLKLLDISSSGFGGGEDMAPLQKSLPKVTVRDRWS